MIARPRTLAARVWRRVRRVPRIPAAMVLVALLGLGAAFFILDKPVEPLVAMKRELAKNGTVVLQGNTGKPRWHRFPIGGPELTESLIGDRACGFESINVCVVELYPEAPSDHFLVRADLRVAASRSNPDEAPFGGLFVAGETSVVSGDQNIARYNLSGLYFEEGPSIRKTRNFRFAALSVIQHPTILPGLRLAGLGSLQFTPSAVLPGPWRTFEIEVWQDRVIPRAVQSDGGKSDFAGGFGAANIQEQLDIQTRNLKNNDAFAELPQSHWNPRGAIGVWGYKAAVDFRNVSIVVLP